MDSKTKHKLNTNWNQETKWIHAGCEPEKTTGAVVPPISVSSTYAQSAPGVHTGYEYARSENPTREAVEAGLAALENAKFGLAFSSGLAAEQAIAQQFTPGSRVLVCDDVYGGTGRMFRKFFAPHGIEFSFVNMSEPSFFTEHQNEKNVSAIWVETPTNPTMKMVDIEKAAQLAKKIGATLIVDNTFCSPYFQNPLALGADIVLHSATKYIGGHSDLVAGVVMTNNQELYDKIKFVQFAIGAMLNPFDCFLIHRSIKTLSVRMQKHSENAVKVANFLAEHPKVETLYFPWHQKSPFYELAKKQTRGPSGMMSIRLKGAMSDSTKFLQNLKVFTLAESLGGVESLVNHPEKMTHASVPEQLRKELGIDSQLIRLSVGIENADDLIDDLKHALSA